MQIYRNLNPILTILPSASSQYTKAVMGEETITLAWEQAAHVDLLLGDYVEYNGVRFTLNKPIVPKKIATNSWSYTAVFQAPIYELTKTAYLLFDNTDTPAQGEFPLTGTPLTFITLLVSNLNRALAPPSGGGGAPQWFIGDVIDGEAKQLTFSNEKCFDVLSKLADEYETEYHVSGNTIHLTSVHRATDLVLEYGSTLYDIERVNVDSADVITRLYPFGGEKNIAANYRGGSKRILIPDPETYLEANVDLYGVIEGFKTFEDVYPRLASGPAGTVTSVSSDIQIFTDANLDFNVNEHLLAGTTAKVRFLTGQCAGYDLEISSYYNAQKSFVVIPNVDDKDFAIPNESIFPAVDDKYVLLDIVMPDIYKANAELELKTKATDYLTKNSHPRVTYRGNFSSLYAKVNTPDIQCGDLVQIVDTDFGINEQIRIVKLTRSILEPWNIQYDLSDTVVKSTLQRMTADIAKNENTVLTVNREMKQNYNRAYRNMDELRKTIFDTDGYFDPTNIKPLSIETSMLSVGSKSQQLQTDVVFKPNDGTYTTFSWSSGSLVHFGISDTEVKTWNIGGGFEDGLVDFPLYIYARCSRTTNAATILLDAAAHKFDYDGDYWFFLLGVLHSPISGVCGISLTYGQTIINGQYIRTGVISSVDGATYFNLTTGDIKAGFNELNGNGSGSLANGKINWDMFGAMNVGNFKIVGGAIVGYNDLLEKIRLRTSPIQSLASLLSPTWINDLTAYNVATNNFQFVTPDAPVVTFSTNGKLIIPTETYIKLYSGAAAGILTNYSAGVTLTSTVERFDILGKGSYTPTAGGNQLLIAAGEYDVVYNVVVTCNVPAGGMGEITLSQGNDATIQIQEVAPSRTEIGNDGFFSFWGSLKYLYFKDDYGLEVMFGNTNGIRVTSQGLQRRGINGWVAL